MPINNVFIIMPFEEEVLSLNRVQKKYTKQHFDDIYAILIEAVQEFRRDIVVDRMEQQYGNLVSAIIRRLSTTDVVIAVLTGRNPNVFYELGIRHTLRLNTIMLVEDWKEYPFDLNSYFSQKYSIEHANERTELKSFIKSRLNTLEGQSLSDSPVIEVLQLTEFEQLKVVNTWETRRAAIQMAGLVREVIGINGIFAQCMDFVHNLNKTKSPKSRPHLNLSWDVIDGFTKNRPVPGLPSKAYDDAERVYGEWRLMQKVWNNAMDKNKKLEPSLFVGIIADTDRKTIAFLHDLLDAWEYVMTKQVCFAIPWSGNIEQATSLIPDTKTLQLVRLAVLKRLSMLKETFDKFDRAFLGVPDSLAQQALRDSAERAKSFESFIKDSRMSPSSFEKVIVKSKRRKSNSSKTMKTKKNPR